MADWNDPRTTRQGFGASPSLAGDVATRTTFDAGLRRHMLSIYNYMTSGVLLTGIVALLFSRGGAESPAAQLFMNGGILAWVVILSPLAIVFAMSFGANRFSTGALQAMFWGFATLMGLSLSTVFLVYTGGSIAATFFATAGAFAGLSLFGYTTKKDMTGWGSFLIMGVIGLVIAMVVNMFLQNPMMMLVINALGVLIFSALIAYDTQRLKLTYYALGGNQNGMAVATSYGALSLFINFINLFQFLLFFLGGRE